MSPQESILSEIKNALETSAELAALLTPTAINTFALFAEENTPCPYFVYKFTKQGAPSINGIGEGKLRIALWFYSTDVAKAYTAEDIIVRLLDNQYITNEDIFQCRIWIANEERKEFIKKDYVKDYDIIYLEITFYLRWIFPLRTEFIHPII